MRVPRHRDPQFRIDRDQFLVIPGNAQGFHWSKAELNSGGEKAGRAGAGEGTIGLGMGWGGRGGWLAVTLASTSVFRLRLLQDGDVRVGVFPAE